ncbi:restriction endonuclease subunit S [Ruminococcus sp.]|uniref:restriction endonuclease subunit S n=1 Tax=Ruminococcus sp. TaxID=41978 RepID=UPI002E7846F1|nr:restriction endonuclease subunit S [Ruminococcus sp.]MEE1263426.1 restriction endonuclease subunit S [Ruminococcus sp.]
MNKEIKQRIEQLNNGKIPKGYKKTDFGVFPSDWETDKTLGDLFDFYGGLSKSRDELGEEGYAYLHYGDLHRGTFNTVSIDHYEQLPKCDISLTGKEKCLMKDGDVAFLDASEDLEGTSRAVLIDNPENKPFIAGLHIIYGKAKANSLDKWFKQYITSSESVKKQFQRLSVGFKVYGVNRDTIPRIRVAFPSSLKEQSRIAEILMIWDKAIELYDKQIDALTRYKAVCLRKMFPAKGQNVPKWRFQGFTGAWEQRKLSDVVGVYDGVHQTPHYTDQGIMFLSVENIATLKSEKYISVEAFERDYKVYPQKGDVLMTRIGDVGTPNVVETSEKLAFYVSLALLKPYGIDSYFLSNVIQSPLFKKGIRDRTLVTAIPQKINKDEIGKLNMLIPKSQDEQYQIGDYFRNLDHLITLHQRKKEAIINQRKILQQYLLNGIVRV